MSGDWRRYVTDIVNHLECGVTHAYAVDRLLAFADDVRRAERERLALICDAEYDRMKRLDCAPGMESHKAMAEQLRRMPIQAHSKPYWIAK